MTKIMYSLTAHESSECISDVIRNITHFSENPAFVVHINIESQSVFEEFKNGIHLLENQLGVKIYLNENRVNTSKDKFTLDDAHFRNYELVKNKDYDYFLLQASNCLFIRKGVEEYIESKDYGLDAYKVSGYWEKRIKEHKALNYFLKAHFGCNSAIEQFNLKGCHEGSFFKKGTDEELFRIVKNIRDFCEMLNDPPKYPTEEVWFQLASLILNQKNKNNYNIGLTTTYLPWARNLEWSIEQVENAMNGIELPKNKYAIKRVDRKYNDEIRTYIRKKSGY